MRPILPIFVTALSFNDSCDMGDYYHNIAVLQTKQGHAHFNVKAKCIRSTICIIQRPWSLPRLFRGSWGIKDLWRRAKTCHDITSKGNVTSDSNALLRAALPDDEVAFYRNILKNMKSDEIARVAEEDRAIRKSGIHLSDKHANSQSELIH